MDSIKKLADLFAKFPSVGPRTARRFVYYLIKLPKENINELAQSIKEIKSKVKLCNFCFNPHELEENLCFICKDTLRNKQLLCIVEKETDLVSIENTKKYKGLYFILGGNVSNFRKSDIANLRIQQLKERVENPKKFAMPQVNFAEIVIATNPTPEGKVTSLLIENSLKELNLPNLKITHLAKGLPVGGELEYADQETLESAFEGRK